MKIVQIAEALEAGDTVWCLNHWFVPRPTLCERVDGCTFKDDEKRPATARELYRCGVFCTWPKHTEGKS